MSRKAASTICCVNPKRAMQILLPLMLLGGMVGLALQPAPAVLARPVTPAPSLAAGQGLGGYLQGVMGLLTADSAMAHQGLVGALSADPDNLNLRQRSMEAALAAGETAEALRLANTLPPANLTVMARLLQFTAAVAQHDVGQARRHLRGLTAAAPPLPVLAVLDAYLGVAEDHRLNTLAAAVQLAHPNWGGQWHAARLHLAQHDTAGARALLLKAVETNPGAYLAVAQLQPLLEPAAQTAQCASFASSSPALAPLLPCPPGVIALPQAPTLTDNTAAALLEFALQIWAEGAAEPAQQIMNITTLLPVQEPLLVPLLPYYRALLADSTNQPARAHLLLQQLAQRPDGFGALADMRLNELRAASATTPRARAAAAAYGRNLAAQHPGQAVFWQSALQLSLAAEEFLPAVKITTHLLTLLPSTPSTTLPQRQANLYFARGAAYAQADKPTLAEADLQRAIELNPAHADALNYLGFLWVEAKRNLPAATELLKRAHLLAPSNGAITDSLGWAYFQQGDEDTAKTYLELAVQQEPESPEILSHLGDTYWRLGKQAEARKLWQQALELATQGASVPNKNFIPMLRRKTKQGL
jgi:tetratricopeptide (TPR) repeat protein